MTKPRYQHNIVLTQELEEAWRHKQQEQPTIRFNRLVCDLLKEALCVTAAPTSITPLGM